MSRKRFLIGLFVLIIYRTIVEQKDLGEEEKGPLSTRAFCGQFCPAQAFGWGGGGGWFLRGRFWPAQAPMG